MKFELTFIENIIHEKKESTNDETKLAREKQRIIKAWQRVVVEQPEKMVKKYIQQHQLALLTALENSALQAGQSNLQVVSVVRELLHYLETQFRDFMQLDYVLPGVVCQQFGDELELNTPSLLRSLTDLKLNANFDSALTSAFEETIAVSRLNRLTYRRKLQMTDLLDGIVVITAKAKDYPERLPRLLIYEFCRVNLNSMESYLAAKAHLRKELDALPTLADQLHKLKKQAQFLKHCKTNKAYYFTYNSRSLCKSLLDWTIDQKYRLENKSHAVSVLDEGLAPEDVIKDSEKVMTSLSRPELALMVTIFFKVGVFTNRSKAAIARFMSLFVRTRNKSRDDHQSAGKMYEDMKNIKISTVDTVDGILDRMKRANNKIRQEILTKTKKTIQ